MSTSAAPETSPTPPAEPPATSARTSAAAHPLKAVIGLVGLIVTIAVIGTLFQALTIYDVPKLLQAVVAIVAGVGGAMVLFYFLNMMVEALPFPLTFVAAPVACPKVAAHCPRLPGRHTPSDFLSSLRPM